MGKRGIYLCMKKNPSQYIYFVKYLIYLYKGEINSLLRKEGYRENLRQLQGCKMRVSALIDV